MVTSWKACARRLKNYCALIGTLFLLGANAGALAQTQVQTAVPLDSYARPGQTVNLTLRWNAVPMSQSFVALVHFVDAAGNTAFGADHMPPVATNTWSGSIQYSRSIAVPASLANGVYTIRVGLYQNGGSWTRQSLAMGPGVTTDGQLRYTVGTLRVSNQTTILPASLSASTVAAGSPLGITLKYNAAPMGENFLSFIHLVSSSGVTYSVDDHTPVPGTATWSNSVSYTRNVTVPATLPNGAYSVRVGLYRSPSTRQSLNMGVGVTVDGELRYTVATLTVSSQTTILPAVLSSSTVTSGSQLGVTIKYNAAPMGENLLSFVHLVNASGATFSVDDHSPVPATSTWSGSVSYTRNITVPATLANGAYTVRIGLYRAPSTRISIAMGSGVSVDEQLRYTVATLTVANKTTVLPATLSATTVAAGNPLGVTLKFNAAPMGENFLGLIHLVNASGVTTSLDDHWPTPPTSNWGGSVSYTRNVTLPASLAAGTYTVRVGLYRNGGDWARQSLAMGTGVTVDDQLRYTVASLTVSGTQQTTSGFAIGQHFHRIPGPAENGAILHRYSVARTHDNNNAQVPTWWKGHDQYDWPKFDDFVNYHSAGGRKILFTVWGSPTWASSKPGDQWAGAPNIPGIRAAPSDLNSWSRMIRAALLRHPGKFYAVECWNEPYGNGPSEWEFFAGTQTELANMCKVLYQTVKSVDASIPVISPPPAFGNPPSVLDARTSQNEPMANFFDWYGFHPYSYTGPYGNSLGAGYNLAGEIDRTRGILNSYGLQNKALIITEWGMWHDPVRTTFCNLSSQQKSEVLYDNFKTSLEKGLKGFFPYAYDNFTPPCGLIGINTFGVPEWDPRWPVTFTYDATVAAGIDRAYRDFAGR
jgi:hypothetical protein